jgi:sarcosine oxidase
VEVFTSRGRYGADRLVLAPGAWASTLLPPPVPIAVERQIFYWPEPDFTPEVPYEAYAEGHPSTWRRPTATGSSTASRWSTGPPAGSSSPTTGRTTG